MYFSFLPAISALPASQLSRLRPFCFYQLHPLPISSLTHTLAVMIQLIWPRTQGFWKGLIDITHHVLCVKFANFTLPSISFLYFRSFGLRLPCLPCQSLIGQFGNPHNCTILSALSPKLLLPLPITSLLFQEPPPLTPHPDPSPTMIETSQLDVSQNRGPTISVHFWLLSDIRNRSCIRRQSKTFFSTNGLSTAPS